MTIEEIRDEYLIACAAMDYKLEQLHAAINELPEP